MELVEPYTIDDDESFVFINEKPRNKQLTASSIFFFPLLLASPQMNHVIQWALCVAKNGKAIA
jgi:hypothetical protein